MTRPPAPAGRGPVRPPTPSAPPRQPAPPREPVASPAARGPVAFEPPRAANAEVSHRMQERLAERRRAEAVRASRRSGRIWLAILAVGLLAWAVFGSPLFAIDEAHVEVTVEARTPGDGGAGIVDPAALAAALEPFVGARLTTLDTGDVVTAITGVEGTRGAVVERAWPRGLRVLVLERIAVAAVPAEGGGFVLVDADGNALRIEDSAPGALPVVEIPVGADNARVLQSVLGVVRQLPTDLAIRVEGVRADTADSVSLELRGGLVVVWGSSAETALKAEVLLLLLESGAAKNAVRVDVSAPALPIVVDSTD